MVGLGGKESDLGHAPGGVLKCYIFLSIHQPSRGLVGHIHKGRGQETGRNARKTEEKYLGDIICQQQQAVRKHKKEDDMTNIQQCLDLTPGWMSDMGIILNSYKIYTVDQSNRTTLIMWEINLSNSPQV